ncbi:MAG: hypothetical protein M0P71_12835 [Melioribacteraceae bacterium]|jgi:hypothetical protein|nr:hypothetical protein [Melioribacteraceae bacterium]
MVNIKQLLDDYNIPVFTEGKNTQRGWINIQCPFCDDKSSHGGFNITKGYYSCWQCKGHHMDQVLSLLLDCTPWQARKIMDEYEVAAVMREERKKVPKANKIIFPKGTTDLQKAHRKYLINRGYDPDEIIKTWGVQGTGMHGPYKHRIIIPIIIDEQIISFTSRDITDRAELRYKSCSIENEVIHHKHVCYGSDFIKYKRAIIVEGPLDTWKIGPGALATFGTGFSPQQVLFLSGILDSAFIMYDRKAEKEARLLGFQLAALINHVEYIYDYGVKDPGEMNKKEIVEIRKKFLRY